MIAIILAGLLSIENIGDTITTDGVIWTGIDQQGQFDDLLEFLPSAPIDSATIALNAIPVRWLDGVPYFELFLRLNETGGPNNYAVVEQFEIEVDGVTLWQLADDNLGTGNGQSIAFADFGPGNNQADASIFIPVDIFVGYDSAELATIRATLSEIDAGVDFVATHDGQFLPDGIIMVPPIPEPKRALLILLALLFILSRRRRNGIFCWICISAIKLNIYIRDGLVI